MKKVIRLTESDLTRIVKRTINEMEDDFFQQQEDESKFAISIPVPVNAYELLKQEGVSDENIVPAYKEYVKHSLGLTYGTDLEEFRLGVMNLIIWLISNNLLSSNKNHYEIPIFNRWGFLFYDIFIYKNIIMKKVIRLTENDLMRIVKRVINESLFEDTDKGDFEDSMSFFEKIGNKIQKLVIQAVKYEVNPYRIRDHSNYFKQVIDYVWLNLDMSENMPPKKDFVKFMKRDFGDQILIHHTNLGR